MSGSAWVMRAAIYTVLAEGSTWMVQICRVTWTLRERLTDASVPVVLVLCPIAIVPSLIASIADRTRRLWSRWTWAVQRRGLVGAFRRCAEMLLGVRPNSWNPADPEHYRRWITTHDPSPRTLAAMKRVAERLEAPQAVTVCVLPFRSDGCAPGALESLAGQVYAGWKRSSPAEWTVREAALTDSDLVAVVEDGARLAPHALWRAIETFESESEPELVYADEDRIEDGRRVAPFFKPDWSPDLLLSCNYLGGFLVFRKGLLERAGGLRQEEGSYDLALRLTEQTSRIGHIREPLCHRVESVRPSDEWERASLESALRRRGVEGSVEGVVPGRYRVRYALRGEPLVSIIIPTRDRVELLRSCVSSIMERSTYRRFEILIVDNESSEPETLRFLAELPGPHRVLSHPEPFNWSAINNRAAAAARGDQLVFLNNDIEVISADWLQAMIEHAQREPVGAVGAKLLYPDGTVQHAGVALGLEGFAGNAFVGLPGDSPGYAGLAAVVRNCSAVTGACLMVRREVFERVGGFDERLPVAFNDVDFCLRVGERGYRVVFTPHAVLRHHESATRPRAHGGSEHLYMRRRWGEIVGRGDPYFVGGGSGVEPRETGAVELRWW